MCPLVLLNPSELLSYAFVWLQKNCTSYVPNNRLIWSLLVGDIQTTCHHTYNHCSSQEPLEQPNRFIFYDDNKVSFFLPHVYHMKTASNRLTDYHSLKPYRKSHPYEELVIQVIST